ncbi:hypothetical protein BX616_002954 [Lobosporangium transversale]|uniref:NUDIX hydrolase domain-like protein n=1 Tax=Lobosporangium transversale TaxID=64571 RepID=A0A1Y2GKZ4_9FUNG|nr:NUDIX hydrolase domain-like protein [Lobosporangium transversale]KAF9916740.1 hypothetical protein BX616_002954 [Lobosporangium transversale]ORZ12543.1 NUDIX hydrolase domain-like protein [Lobosporangium transversale]|eukprot:XP_021880162.1 NUDIX hydrolase domain-like protein [Lobosporangium transversale]
MYLNQKSIQALENLKNYPPSVDNYQAKKRSAVLVALVANNEGDLEVILTARSSSLRTGAGESAFPGGKQDPEDADLITTAKREAFEEVRLLPSNSQVLTVLSPVLSRHLHVVTPVVAFCPDLRTTDLTTLLRPNPGEVAAIFTEPLEYFLSPRPGDYNWFDMDWISNHRVHRFERCGTHNFILEKLESSGQLPQTATTTSSSNSSSVSNSGEDKQLEKKEIVAQENPTKVGWAVYGLTAGVLIEVAKIAYQRNPDFETFAPGQTLNNESVVAWYNQKYGPQPVL